LKRAARIAVVALLALGSLALGPGCSHSSGSHAPLQTNFELTPPSGTALPPATTAAAYDQSFTVLSGGTPPYTFTPISIPAGLTLTPVAGSGADVELKGTPTQMGQATVSFQVVDSTNQKFSNVSYTLTVN
jgi:hypothetical protein